VVLLALLATAALAAPGSAGAAASPPTVTSAFTPAAIGAGGTSALSITITNPNSSSSLSGIGLTDTLPSGVVVDTPNGQSGTCGSAGVLTALSGSSTITLSGGKLAGGASCTISAAVTAAAAGSYVNSTGPVSSTEGGAGTGDTETLTVVAPPSVTVTSPKEGQVVDFGAKVRAAYSCLEAAGGPGITDCSGDVASGAPIDTSSAGPQTFTVTAVSDDGQVTTETIDYTVRPDNRFTIAKIRAAKSGVVSLDVVLPGPGRLELLETAPTANIAGALTTGRGRFAFGRLTKNIASPGHVRVTLRPTARGRALVRKHHRAVTIRIAVAYTPTGGKVRVHTSGVIRIPS
jgi:hypothetical protein